LEIKKEDIVKTHLRPGDYFFVLKRKKDMILISTYNLGNHWIRDIFFELVTSIFRRRKS